MFSFGIGPNGWRMFQRHLQQIRKTGRSGPRNMSASSSSAGASTGSSGGMLSNPVLKSGLISGSLSLAGDLIAQVLTNRDSKSGTASYDAARAARMGSFGLFFYGPYQHFWYRALDRAMPVRNMPNFLAKVTLNQLCLAPIVIAGVFAWNLALQNKIKEFPDKTRRDFVPTLHAGWKFWVPAASVNFLAVPLQHQVLYMSLCGVVWTGYLSYSSAIATQLQEAGVGSSEKGGKGKKK